MPIYIDFHKLEGKPTEEDIRLAHQADLARQEEFGVRFHQYWFNEEASTVFCLIEGPDPEAVKTCHWSTHGNTPCNIQEVEPVYLKLFLGEEAPLDRHMTLTMEGKTDVANRTILLTDIRRTDATENKYYLVPIKPKNLVVDAIAKFNGRFVEYTNEEKIVGVFDSPINAIRCAKNIRETIERLRKKHEESSEWNITYRIALNNGQPLTEKDGFFEIAIRQANRLCLIAQPDQIIITAQLKELLKMETEGSLYPATLSSARVLTGPEVVFTDKLFTIIEQNLQAEPLNVSKLSKLIGLSRPQLYRKVIALTGKSPNDFIKEVRMRKAWFLLQSKKKSISEVAYEVGFSSPSYFSKTFHEKYGYTPSELQSA
ncbi:nickel-binding protein [Catalinimonas sp. 4WD22]|uniref:nickel-binding protein n=1 Tax=Catalinimonas locisalis TaxID=3133978 RepID=UPI0031019FD7